MAHQGRVGPSCRACEQPMARRGRAPAQAHLRAEFVCWNLDCTDFGIYRHRSERRVPGTDDRKKKAGQR